MAEPSTCSSRWFPAVLATWDPCNTTRPLTKGNRQDAEPQAVVAGVGVDCEMEWVVFEMVVAVLAVRAGGGLTAAGGGRVVVYVPVIMLMLFFLFFFVPVVM